MKGSKSNFIVIYLTFLWVLLEGLFYFIYIPLNLCKLCAFFAEAILLFLTIHYWRNKKTRTEFYPIITIVILAIVCIFTAFFLHDQPPLLSIRTSLPWFQIGFCFFLLKTKCTEQEVYRFVWWAVVIHTILYIYAVWAAPQLVFDPSGNDTDDVNTARGWFYIRIGGTGFLYLMFYWQLNKFLQKRNIKSLLFVVFCFVMIMMKLSRQHMFITIFMMIFITMKNLRLIYKLMVIGFVIILAVYVLPHIEIFQNLQQLTESQLQESNGGENYIRILSYIYYFNYNDNIGNILLGNGIYHADSHWGKEIYSVMENDGLILSDVGWVSFYFYFGIIGLWIIIQLAFKMLSYKIDENHKFISYFVIAVYLGTIFSNQIHGSLIELSTVYYIIFLKKEQEKLLTKTS